MGSSLDLTEMGVTCCLLCLFLSACGGSSKQKTSTALPRIGRQCEHLDTQSAEWTEELPLFPFNPDETCVPGEDSLPLLESIDKRENFVKLRRPSNPDQISALTVSTFRVAPATDNESELTAAPVLLDEEANVSFEQEFLSPSQSNDVLWMKVSAEAKEVRTQADLNFQILSPLAEGFSNYSVFKSDGLAEISNAELNWKLSGSNFTSIVAYPSNGTQGFVFPGGTLFCLKLSGIQENAASWHPDDFNFPDLRQGVPRIFPQQSSNPQEGCSDHPVPDSGRLGTPGIDLGDLIS